MGIDANNNKKKTPRLLDSGANFNACHEDDDVQTLQGHRLTRAIEPSGAVMQSSNEATTTRSPSGVTSPEGTFDGHMMPTLKIIPSFFGETMQ